MKSMKIGTRVHFLLKSTRSMGAVNWAGLGEFQGPRKDRELKRTPGIKTSPEKWTIHRTTKFI